MPEHRLDRLFEQGDGLFGRLVSARGTVYFTAERRWADNRVGVSCIRPGRYELVRHPSRKLKGWDHVYALRGGDVGLVAGPGIARVLCELHPANLPLELEGCIALGRSINMAPAALVPAQARQTMLATSVQAVAEFFDELEDTPGPHWLTITGGVPDGSFSRSDR